MSVTNTPHKVSNESKSSSTKSSSTNSSSPPSAFHITVGNKDKSFCSWLRDHPVAPGRVTNEVLRQFQHLVRCFTEELEHEAVRQQMCVMFAALISSSDSNPSKGVYSAAVPKKLRVLVQDTAVPQHGYKYYISIPKKLEEANGIPIPFNVGCYYMTGRCWVLLSNPQWRLALEEDGMLRLVAPEVDPGQCTMHFYLTEMNVLSQVYDWEKVRLNDLNAWVKFKNTIKDIFLFTFLDHPKPGNL
jgi:hypothetical protein